MRTGGAPAASKPSPVPDPSPNAFVSCLSVGTSVPAGPRPTEDGQPYLRRREGKRTGGHEGKRTGGHEDRRTRGQEGKRRTRCL